MKDTDLILLFICGNTFHLASFSEELASFQCTLLYTIDELGGCNFMDLFLGILFCLLVYITIIVPTPHWF